MNQEQANHIAAIYFEGGYDSEIESYLMTEGFPLGYFANEYENNPKFKLLIDACRIHARAFWERMLRQNVGNKSFNVPAWVMAVRGQAMRQYEDKGGNTINIDNSTKVISTSTEELLLRMQQRNQQLGILPAGSRVVADD